MNKCPYCSGDLVLDSENGLLVCSSCGHVIEEGIVDTGPEWRAYTIEDRLERERTGSHLTPKVHDWGLTTKIGNEGNFRDRTRLWRIQKLQERIRVSSRDKKLVTYLSELNNECAKLGLPERVKETSALIMRKLIEMGYARRIDKTALIVAVIYYACQIVQYPKHLKEIKDRYNVSNEELWKALMKVQTVIKSEKMTSKISPKDYIPRIVNALGLPQYIITKSSELIDQMHREGLTSGKGYLALSAASVYLISTLLDHKKTQKEIADAINITEVTIRNRYKDIVENFSIEVFI
jgi:transcription initiation factor TFIIB